MRNQNTNPAFKRFKHLLVDNFYPARWVDIFSNTDEQLRYIEVEVVFIPRGVEGIVLDREFWDEFADYNERWLGDLGNSVAGWMEPGGLNPEKIFGGMLFYGFSNQRALDEAVAEFSSIVECGWARRMKDGEFSRMLRNSAQDRGAVMEALEAETQHVWARDMLGVMIAEGEF